MKIAYIIKKGIHFFPPCLAQILYLNDLRIKVVVYHGKNSEYINKVLDDRGIEHYNIGKDADSKNRFESMLNFYQYGIMVNRLVKEIPKDYLLWFGNCESAIAMKKRNLVGRKYVLSILELYDRNTIYDKGLKKIIGNAEAVICCEKHRAAIMRSYYSELKAPIYVVPNKPYDNGESVPNLDTLPTDIINKIDNIKNSKIIIYQGIVTKDRPLDKIAQALKILNNKEYTFVVMGNATEQIMKELSAIYHETVFMGYIPSPQHLCITQYASVGVANYDCSCLNNVFCAPNKIYEYAKFGISMLTSLNVGLTETVGEIGAAECVDFSSPEEIALGLKKIFANIEEYSMCARKFYEQTNNENTFKEIVKYLQSNENGVIRK